MKNNFFKILAMGLLFGFSAFAGIREVGNGGVGLYCAQEPDPTKRVHLFDLYEGQALDQLIPIQSDEDYELQALSYFKHLDSVAGNLYGVSFEVRIKDIIRSLRYLPFNTKLSLTEDVNNFIYSRDCELIQLLNFRNDGNVWVDLDYFQFLSNTEKAAALLHEAIYSYFRDEDYIANLGNGDKDSSRTRRVVALLIAGKKLEKVDDSVSQPADAKKLYCYTKEASASNRASTEFNLYQIPGGKTHIQFERLNGHELLSKATIDADLDITKESIYSGVDSLVDRGTTVRIGKLENNKTEITISEGNLRVSEPITCETPYQPPTK